VSYSGKPIRTLLPARFSNIIQISLFIPKKFSFVVTTNIRYKFLNNNNNDDDDDDDILMENKRSLSGANENPKKIYTPVCALQTRRIVF